MLTEEEAHECDGRSPYDSTGGEIEEATNGGNVIGRHGICEVVDLDGGVTYLGRCSIDGCSLCGLWARASM